jgi:hypothetical protein
MCAANILAFGAEPREYQEPCLMTPRGAGLHQYPLRGYAAFFSFAHLARCAAAILLRPAAEIVRFGVGVGLASFTFAHRAFCARLIFWRPAADMVPFLDLGRLTR